MSAICNSDAEFNEPFKYGIIFPAMGGIHPHRSCSKSVICNDAVMHISKRTQAHLDRHSGRYTRGVKRVDSHLQRK